MFKQSEQGKVKKSMRFYMKIAVIYHEMTGKELNFKIELAEVKQFLKKYSVKETVRK